MELHKDHPERSLTHWPQILMDTVTRGEGLILLSGNRYSQILEIEKALALTHGNLKIHRTDKLSREHRSVEVENCDVLIYHGPCYLDSILAALDLCEEGRLVIQVTMAPTSMASLRKVLSALAEKPNKHTLWRYTDQLSLILSQMSIPAVNEVDLFIHEVVLGTPNIKRMIFEDRIEDVEALLKSHTEDQGVLSFNQSLLKLMIRRRIDLKMAFAKTRDPENLDELLKKVGI